MIGQNRPNRREENLAKRHDSAEDSDLQGTEIEMLAVKRKERNNNSKTGKKRKVK